MIITTSTQRLCRLRTFDFNGVGTGFDGNIGIDGSEDGASLSAPTDDLLVEGTGADAGIGVDIDLLNFIDEADVGPDSTWDND